MLKIKNLIKKLLSKFGFQIQRIHNSALVEPNPIHQWDKEKQFMEIMNQIAGNTLVDTVRCFMLFQFAIQIIHVSGDVAEVGVYKGGTARLLSKTLELTGKKIHLFDTFSGMPPCDPVKDICREGDFSDTSLSHVKASLGDLVNISYHQGLFPDTAVSVMNKVFCLVHIDVDIYKSVMDCCEFFYPRLVSGGIMIFDDYGFLSCPGAKQAVDNFFAERPEKPIYLSTGQCLVIKLSRGMDMR